MSTGPADLIDLLADFYKKPPGSIRIVTICSSGERGYIETVLAETMLKDPARLERYERIDGAAYMAGHPDFTARGDPDTVGELQSHLDLYRETLEGDEEVLVVLKEGCMPTIRRAEFLGSLRKYFAEIGRLVETFQMEGVADLILLGSTGASPFLPIGHMVKAATSFTDAYAYVITRPFMEKALAKQPRSSIELTLSEILRDEKAHCICPFEDSFFLKHLSAVTLGLGVSVDEVSDSSDDEDGCEV
jgi:hypothetical protein